MMSQTYRFVNAHMTGRRCVSCVYSPIMIITGIILVSVFSESGQGYFVFVCCLYISGPSTGLRAGLPVLAQSGPAGGLQASTHQH